MKRLAILVPAFNESRHVNGVIAGFKETRDSLLKIGMDTFLVVIDDGSTDGTFSLFERRLADEKISARLIRFRRNYGKDSAVFAGLTEGDADYYVIVDADGQTPFSLIPSMAGRLFEKKVEVVYAVKSSEPYGWLRRTLTSLFFFLSRKLLGIDELRKGSSDFMLFARSIRDQLLQLQEKEVVVRNLVRWLGRPAEEISFHPEVSAQTAFTFKKLFLLGVKSIISFSHILRINFFIALFYWVFSFFYGALILYNKISGKITPGLSTMTLLTLISFGLMFFMIAIIGEYLITLFEEVKKRPRYSIERISDFPGNSPLN